jgi:hypothetical protein
VKARGFDAVAVRRGDRHRVEEGDRVSEATGDAGPDAGSCPDYVPNDAGVVQLTRRGCPLTIDYAIR